ncbi:hypothetical protein GRI89_17085 [Altererythrobacter salegens]|uniref:Signal transduction histidine kinase internal region domain-containing protein n=1 Tax=Croceibacterium salegens TaxID=1737568 RepID=A0A6I4SZ58_9SPHN|nr:histidine kinase [Croceibacterium salegens]MXO61261.1 hypothetical protein [Croceibacterium salegens]
MPSETDGNLLQLLRQGEGRFALWLTPVVWVLSSVLFVIPMFVAGQEPSLYLFLSIAAISLGGTAISYALFVAIWRVFQREMRSKLVVATLAVLAAAALLALLDLAAAGFIASFQPGNTLSTDPIFRLTNNFAVFIPHFGLLGAIYALLAHNRLALDRDRLLAEANTLAQQARLSALRYQLNPHFLFNTLNSISSLVITKRNRQAEHMLEALSEFLRSTLARDPDDPQTLDIELETIAAYIAIERIRFGERLALDIDCPPHLRDAGIPPFLIQPLIENAIKHAVAETDETVNIVLAVQQDGEDLVLIVENDHCPDPALSEKRSGIGLRNIEARLSSLYGERGRIETLRRQGTYLAIARMPLVIEQPR